MKVRNTVSQRIAMTIAVAAIAISGSMGLPAAANAQVMQDGSVRFVSSSIGYVPGQTLRFNVVSSQAIGPTNALVAAQVKVFDGQGNLLAQSDEKAVPAGQFRSFDLTREALRVPGEAGNGRLQVRAEIIFRYLARPDPNSHDSFLVSAEVFDTRSGANTGGDYYTGSVTVSGDGFGD